MGGRGDASEAPQQIGQLGRHCAGLVAVELRQRLGLEVAEQEEGVAPQQLHLQDTVEGQVAERKSTARQRSSGGGHTGTLQEEPRLENHLRSPQLLHHVVLMF